MDPFTATLIIGGAMAVGGYLGQKDAPELPPHLKGIQYDYQLSGRGERANELRRFASDVDKRDILRLRDPSGFAMQQRGLEELWRTRDEGDQLARKQLFADADTAAARARGMAVAQGPQNQAMAARQAMMQSGAAQREAAGRSAMADIAAKRSARELYQRAALGLSGQQLQRGMADIQGQVGQQQWKDKMRLTGIQQRAEEAYRQAVLSGDKEKMRLARAQMEIARQNAEVTFGEAALQTGAIAVGAMGQAGAFGGGSSGKGSISQASTMSPYANIQMPEIGSTLPEWGSNSYRNNLYL